MSAAGILRLATPKYSDESASWSLTVDRAVCVGPPEAKHMSGGACMAAAIHALEIETGRPLIQANAQFLAAPPLGSDVEIRVHNRQAGRSISQAAAAIRTAGREGVRIATSLGARRDIGAFDWTRAPDVAPPEACERIPFVREDPGDLHTQLDMRLALDERPNPAGRMAFWVKTPKGGAPSSAFLALVGDYLPEAIHMNIGRPAGAASLDNSIRVLCREETDWLLCETRLHGIHAGIFHGHMSLFSRQGQLLAVASQSGAVRLLEPTTTSNAAREPHLMDIKAGTVRPT